MATWSGLFEEVYGESYAFNKTNVRAPGQYQLSRLLKRKDLRQVSEAISKLAGDVDSFDTSNTVSYSRIAHVADTNSNVLGGVATIETHQLVGANINSAFAESGAKTARANDAQDVTDLQAITDDGDRWLRQPSSSGTVTYPTDGSGNGGGGKGEGAA